MVATATPDAPPRDAASFLASVQAWQWQLAHRFSRRTRLDAEELFQELVLDVLEHFHYYRPERGSPTTFTMLRARGVVQELVRRRRCRVRLVPVSQLLAVTNQFDEEVLAATAVARPDPEACAGRIEREEDVEELRRVVGEAVAGLREGWAARLTRYYGLGGEGDGPRRGRPGVPGRYREMADEAGVTRSAIHQSVVFGCKALAADERLRELAERHGLAPAVG